MSKPQRSVVLGFLGTQLDGGQGAGRWEKWRPTIAITQAPDLEVDRLELFVTRRYRALGERVRDDIKQTSPATTVNLIDLPLNDPWDFGEVYGALYDWARDYPFNPENETYLAHITTGTHVAQICLFLLVEARLLPGVLLQTSPPRRQTATDPGSWSIIDLDLSRYDAIAARFQQERTDAVSFLKSGIETRNKQFNTLIEEIERVAVRSSAAILLVGPTGAGKSMLARRMYELKKNKHRVTGAFVEVNCATLRGDSAASALFGHKRGAFTGAASDRAGLLKTADAGVLFLDEIGELGLDEQAMLLTAIEEKRFWPVGADYAVQSQFQLIAGTHRDLRLDVAAGRFREDLFSRINLWTYNLPGLSSRAEDIEPNIDHLLGVVAREQGDAVRFNIEARERYVAFATSSEALWRGNFRDLSASVTRMATLADGGRISVTLVEAEIQRLRWMWNREPDHDPLENTVDSSVLEQMDQFDRVQLRFVIDVCRRSASLSDAGRTLFDRSREQRSSRNDADRLRKYLAKWDLEWGTVRNNP